MSIIFVTLCTKMLGFYIDLFCVFPRFAAKASFDKGTGNNDPLQAGLVMAKYF